jgi:pantothenate kinase
MFSIEESELMLGLIDLFDNNNLCIIFNDKNEQLAISIKRKLNEHKESEKTKRMNLFYSYVFKYYGPEGIYPMGATMDQIMEATAKYLKTENVDFCGDSYDREMVRDIMVNDYALVPV